LYNEILSIDVGTLSLEEIGKSYLAIRLTYDAVKRMQDHLKSLELDIPATEKTLNDLGNNSDLTK